MKNRLSKDDLKKLRSEITLCSVMIKDYKNSFGFDPNKMCDFFEGYAEYIELLMIDGDQDTVHFYEYLKDYDNEDTLYDYYSEMSESELDYYFEKPDVVTDVLVGASAVLGIAAMIATKLILTGQMFC